MIVGRNFPIAIATLSDWLKHLAPIFLAPCTCDFSRSLCKLQVIGRNSDWRIALFALIPIPQSN